MAIYNGTPGNDQYFGTPDPDEISGLGGQDQLRGGSGDDTIEGGDGPDSLYGDQGADRINGGTGDDVIRGGRGNDVLHGGDGIDMLAGDRDNDALFGGAGDDILLGGPGDDRLQGDAGADILLGGPGRDVVSYTDSPAAVDVGLRFGRGEGGTAEGDILVGIESIIGSDHDDELDGRDDRQSNVLSGGRGDDILFGGGHDHPDRLQGGPGADHLQARKHPGVMEGGPGADRFEYFGRQMDSDGEIVDFTKGEDLIVFDFSNGDVSEADLDAMLQGSNGNRLDLSLLGPEFAEFGDIELNVQVSTLSVSDFIIE